METLVPNGVIFNFAYVLSKKFGYPFSKKTSFQNGFQLESFVSSDVHKVSLKFFPLCIFSSKSNFFIIIKRSLFLRKPPSQSLTIVLKQTFSQKVMRFSKENTYLFKCE